MLTTFANVAFAKKDFDITVNNEFTQKRARSMQVIKTTVEKMDTAIL